MTIHETAVTYMLNEDLHAYLHMPHCKMLYIY